MSIHIQTYNDKKQNISNIKHNIKENKTTKSSLSQPNSNIAANVTITASSVSSSHNINNKTSTKSLTSVISREPEQSKTGVHVITTGNTDISGEDSRLSRDPVLSTGSVSTSNPDVHVAPVQTHISLDFT